jgi:hypothetical protein
MMMRFLNPQGIAGVAVSLCLAILLVLQKHETNRWKTQSARYEELYRGEEAAFSSTVASYRAAADAARAADLAAAQRAAAEQRAISQRSQNALESRLADARSRAEQLRFQAAGAAADPRRGASAPVRGVPAASGGADPTAGQDGLPLADRLTATEQAIQLDELITWVKAQAQVDPNAEPRR